MAPILNNEFINIRRAERLDIPSIVRLLADDDLGQTRERFQDPIPETYYAAFDHIDNDPNHELVVVDRDGEVIGTLTLSFVPSLTYQGGTRAQIEAVRVDARFRGQGIGEELVQWAINRARDKHCHMLQLTTHASRLDAHRFYERLGFVASHIGMKLELIQVST